MPVKQDPCEAVIERIAATPLSDFPKLLSRHPEWSPDDLGLALLSLYITTSMYYLNRLDKNERRGVVFNLAGHYRHALLDLLDQLDAAAPETGR